MTAMMEFLSGVWVMVTAAQRSAAYEFRPDPHEIPLVQQQFSDEVDINTIARRFGISPSTPLGPVSGVYADFTGIHDYESALRAVERADERFMELPPDFRERFGNDPGRLIAFAQSVSEEEFSAAVAPPAAPVDGGGAPAPSGDLPRI